MMTDRHDQAGMPPDSVTILGGPGQGELTEQRSRFLGFAVPVTDETEAREAIASIRQRYHDARHVCSAWRLGAPPPPREYRHDDGEPAGTAGEPLLAAIRRQDLTNTLVVVVRYFGGVKLGTGGLARAYGAAAALALEAAPRKEQELGRCFRMRFTYALRRAVEPVVQTRGGRATAESYGAFVDWEVWLPHSGCAGFAAAISESTAGAVTVHEIESP
jgi:uncharacterized YigZ family protein